MGLRRGYTDEEWREPLVELVQERFCNDYCIVKHCGLTEELHQSHIGPSKIQKSRAVEKRQGRIKDRRDSGYENCGLLFCDFQKISGVFGMHAETNSSKD